MTIKINNDGNLAHDAEFGAMHAPDIGYPRGGGGAGTGPGRRTTKEANQVMSAVALGVGTFRGLDHGTQPTGKPFLLPLSGVRLGSPYDDLHLTMVTNGDRFGESRKDREVFPIDEKEENGRWIALEDIQANRREHGATPFFVLGKSESLTPVSTDKYEVKQFGKSDIESLALVFPGSKASVVAWATNLSHIIRSLEAQYDIDLDHSLRQPERDLITSIRGSLSSNRIQQEGGPTVQQEIIGHLVQYDIEFGGRGSEKAVPEFLRIEVAKERAERSKKHLGES